MTDDAMLIELKNVSVHRGTTRILDKLNIAIPQQQHIAVVGPNGSGKSTLLKLLLKFFYPSVVDGQSGTVSILGREEWNVWELRAHLGFISSEIDNHFTIGRSARLNALQAVLTGFYASELEPDPDSVSSEMNEEALRLLELFQVDSRTPKYVGHMSTGERRRVLLARALVRRPQAIVLDEPTSGLDLRARAEFLGTLNHLARTGTQIVLVTHHLEEILPCIGRCILLKSGNVFFDGPTDDALKPNRISSLFDCDIQVHKNRNGFFTSQIS